MNDLLPGQSGEVAGIDGDPQHVIRLYELGFRVGADLQMMQRGSACVVRVAGTKICLRPANLRVFVHPR